MQMTWAHDLPEETKRALLAERAGSPQAEYVMERALYPITTEEQWLEVYRRWHDKGVNLESLLLKGQVNNWIPPDIAAELLGD
jgi:hypothetical protein